MVHLTKVLWTLPVSIKVDIVTQREDFLIKMKVLFPYDAPPNKPEDCQAIAY